MSMRFEWIDAPDAGVTLRRGPGGEDEEPQVEDHALVLGNPYATALVVTGTVAELRAFAQRVLTAAEDRNPNHCRYCGAHLAEPHGPECPVGAGVDHDDDLSGACAGAEITLTYQAPVYVGVGGGAVRRVRVNDEGAELHPAGGGECAGCHRVLLADHPAVAAAAAVAEDGGTEWAAWEIGP